MESGYLKCDVMTCRNGLWGVSVCGILSYFTERLIARTASRKKNGFVTATKSGTTEEIFVAATKNFATATKRFVDRTKHFVDVTKCFCYPYFNK